MAFFSAKWKNNLTKYWLSIYTLWDIQPVLNAKNSLFNTHYFIGLNQRGSHHFIYNPFPKCEPHNDFIQ